MTNQQSTEPSQPCIGSFDLPTTFVASQLPAVFIAPYIIAPYIVVLSVRRNQFDATPLTLLSQQVEGEGNSSGKNRHAAPVCRTHNMPSKHPRFEAGGRPRLPRCRLGLGSKGSISCHCSSVNSLCCFFMAEAQQFNRLKRKYLI
jgi:hypothetical protein